LGKITETGTEILKRRGRPPNMAKPNGKMITEEHEPVGYADIPIRPTVMQMQENLAQSNPTIIPVAEQPVIAQPLKVAIIGTAPSSRDLAPFNDPTWTIWACSPGNQGILPRVDAWFEVHTNLLWPECISYGKPYVEWLKQQKFPIYMQDQSLVPNAISLPIQELVQEFGKYFFTSSFAYMVAMAIKAGAKEIALFGVDMASKDEYILQRPGGHYFMQKAAERGIKVSVPFESDLAQAPELYGYADSTPFGRKLHVRKKEIEGRIAGMSQERDKLNHSITYLQGALEDLDYVKSIFGGLQT
jgi:hypothetical protein